MDPNASTIKLAENNSTPGSLVRPSSLNYKISLSEAVVDFIKKDMPLFSSYSIIPLKIWTCYGYYPQ